MPLHLRPPRPDDEAALRRLHDELAADGFTFLLADGTWDEVLAQVRRESAGTDLPPGRVRADFLVAEVDGEPVGRVSIRYALNDYLREVGGHVGYGVAPAHRRRGYATEMLRQSVALLADAGVDRVLVTCDEDNAGSAAVIEACGGVLEDVRAVEGEAPKRRYWIDARAAVA
ncbi:putative acetyltransferase [Isoptericola sp. CG 20/1183]|uniref:Acetyltransferase n=1 Tax=Isoptericola halotolerans TaxID=300560 RepID=A0ABX5EJB3_9MICO|nr:MULTISPECIES: GNAT family N-acetyltransferase [Isoptericola]PRZ08611.1 putative acetyltransferase [Isoptericola halotolerans]PRZ10942.1 putative acetyltransferase [Isoptericola sp. CG 20/1183]